MKLSVIPYNMRQSVLLLYFPMFGKLPILLIVINNLRAQVKKGKKDIINATLLPDIW